jgi:hypothetical protein
MTGPLFGGFIGFQQHKGDRRMYGEHGLGALHRAQAARAFHLGALRLAGEGDDFAGQENAEAVAPITTSSPSRRSQVSLAVS